MADQRDILWADANDIVKVNGIEPDRFADCYFAGTAGVVVLDDLDMVKDFTAWLRQQADSAASLTVRHAAERVLDALN